MVLERGRAAAGANDAALVAGGVNKERCCMGAVFPGVPHQDALWLKQNFDLDTFVETGTHIGSTASWAAGVFARVVTIELDKRLYEHSSSVLAPYRNVRALFGDTREHLRNLPAGERRYLFWLDAHWSGEGTAGAGDECPLLQEIVAIGAQKLEGSVVLIDDARMFLAPPPPPHDPSEWPRIDAVLNALNQFGHRANFVIDDVIMSLPPAGLKAFTEHHVGSRSSSATSELPVAPSGEPKRNDHAALTASGRIAPNRPVRLHLGCGETMLEGYVNIDYPQTKHSVFRVAPDYEADLTALSFPDGSVDEIRLHHVFEHFNRVVALGMLVRWHRWLGLGGSVLIETPDFAATAEAALRETGAARVALVRHLEGDQAADWAYHVGQWYPERFERTLAAFGFGDVVVETASTERWHQPALHNVTVRAVKTEALSIDVLIRRAEELLWESTVAAAEKPTWTVWCDQLRRFLSNGEVPAGPTAHRPVQAA